MTNNGKIPKKVLFIHHATGIGGALLSLLFLLQKIDRSRYAPKVLCLHGSDAVQMIKSNAVNVETLNSWRSFSHSEVSWISWYRPDLLIMAVGAWFATAFLYAPRILRKERPELVYLNSTPLSAWAVAAKRLNIPVVCHIREPVHRGYLGLRNVLLKKVLGYSVDRFIAVNEQNAQTIDAPAKTVVIYDFVHFSTFDRKLTPADIPPPNGNKQKVALYVGGGALIKGFGVVVDCLQYLDPGIVVVVAGPLLSKVWWRSCLRTIVKPRLARLQRTLNRAPNAIEIGLQKDIAKWIAACDVLVSPFTVPHFSRPIVEAGSMGKPVVATRVEGMEELVDDGDTGLLVPPNDSKSLATAINQICGDENLAARMGDSGYRKARKLFDGEKNARETFEVFDDVLATHNRHGEENILGFQPRHSP